EHILNSRLPEHLAESAAPEEEEVEQPKGEVESALIVLEHLEMFELQQELADKNILGTLIKMKRKMEASRLRKMGSQHQEKITMYL
ncbi:hypothetical protein Q9L58_009673, partial [Maublancomyces gigas]